MIVRHRHLLSYVELPDLDVGPESPLGAYTEARRLLEEAPDAGRADIYTHSLGRRWLSTLDTLVEWAWAAVMAPVLDEVATWGLLRDPRLVLVPTGAMAAVPWHAARRLVNGRLRYVVEDMVLSYAASGKLLADIVRRRALPYGQEPALVANPTGDLYWADISADAVRDAFYPGAAMLGLHSERPGTKSEVLGLMPSPERDGASLLQLSTHGLALMPSTGSRLLLANDEVLTVEEILQQADGRPHDAPGGLVICDACTTDLTEGDHDEALTLGTAFLAAGYATAIGTRWPVNDAATAILMYVFHHYLNDGLEPVDALRAAQVWAADPARRAPERMPAELAEYTTDPGLADVYAWAAFTHHGK